MKISRKKLFNAASTITGDLVRIFSIAFIFCCIHEYIAAQEQIKVVGMKQQPIVLGKLNGKNAYFLIDTGADISILNKADIRRFKIKSRKTLVRDHVISGLVSQHEQEILVATNANLYMANKKMNVCFKVLDITNVKVSLGRDCGIWINGIIGSDLMQQYNFVIDYGRQRISFTHLATTSSTCL